ncbi:MAG: dephospho-CoA kinase [Planctomycetaceae bacterium]
MTIHHKPIIGIVGGVGSGKSAVARWFAEHCCGSLIDADAVGHQVLLQEEVKIRLRETFGDDIFAEGEVDRKQLGTLVFGDGPEQTRARRQLESIVHPAMAAVFQVELAKADADDEIRLVIFDAAVLLETGWREQCDVVVFVEVPHDQRVQRVAASRGWTEGELARREASQWSLDRKRQAADIVVDNSETIEHTGQQLVDTLVEQGWLTDRRTPCSIGTP